MRAYISVDMEGIAGISHPAPTESNNAKYPAAVELAVGETNAAIEPRGPRDDPARRRRR